MPDKGSYIDTQLKIMHLSNLRIGINQSVIDTYEKLVAQLGNHLLNNNIDYIVVNGNLTEDGSKESFKLVKGLLMLLVKNLLKFHKKKHQKVFHLSRLVIVPGVNDIQRTLKGELNFENYKEFFDDFYTGSSTGNVSLITNRSETFSENEILCKSLRDVTFLNIPFWLKDQVSKVRKKLKAIINSEHFHFLETTPVFLIDLFNDNSSINKQFHEELIRLNPIVHFDRKKKTVSILEDAKINLNLGHTGTNIVSNLIYLRAHSKNRTKLRIEFWGFDETLKVWKRDIKARGRLDKYIPDYHRKLEIRPINDMQIESMIYKLQNPSIYGIILIGFPGSGKSEFYDYLEENYDNCFTLKLESYETEELQQLEGVETTGNSIILIKDEYYDNLSQQIEKRENEVNKFKLLLKELGDEYKGYIYFHSTVHNKSLFDLPAKLNFKTLTVNIKQLHEDSFTNMVKQYSSFAPIQHNTVARLTGRYAGYSRIILQEILQKYVEEMYRDLDINENYCNDILNDILMINNGEFAREAKLFIDSIKDIHGGNQLYKHIISKIPNKRDIVKKKSLIIKEIAAKPNFGIEINIDNANTTKAIKDDMIMAAESLTEINILTKPKPNKDIYHLNLIAPFLVPANYQNEPSEY